MTYDNVADHFVSHKMKLATTAGQFRLTIRLKVKEGEGRKLVEGILNPGDPISLKFSTSDKTIRLVMSQSKIQNQDLEFWATFELRCDGFEGFDSAAGFPGKYFIRQGFLNSLTKWTFEER